MTVSGLTQNLIALAREGFRLNVWPTAAGEYQANVAERSGQGWICVTDADPVFAIQEALRMRATGHSGRKIVPDVEAQQIDIESVIVATPLVQPAPAQPVDDFEELL